MVTIVCPVSVASNTTLPELGVNIPLLETSQLPATVKAVSPVEAGAESVPEVTVTLPLTSRTIEAFDTSKVPLDTKRLPVIVIAPVPPVKLVPELVRLFFTVRVFELFLNVPPENAAEPHTIIFWLVPVPPSPSHVPPENVRVEVVPEVPTVTDLEFVSVSKIPAELVSVPSLERAKLSTSRSVPAPE